MIEQVLLIVGSGILGVLGIAHLIYTFFSDKFDAYDKSVTAAMKKTTLVLTKETTMWKAWVGFNASHSLGAILVPLFFIPLTVNNISIIQDSLWLSTLPALIGLSYFVLAKNYWFKIPLIGICLACACFIGAAVVINI